jgi:sec-independent protein translocase protein TatB
MLDLGWTELLVIGIVALIVVGPKDLPGMFRTVGNFVGKAKRMARDFSQAMNDAADEAGVKDVSDGLRKASNPVGSAMDEAKKATSTFTQDTMAGPKKSKMSEDRAADAEKIRQKSAEVAQERLDREAEERAAKKADVAERPADTDTAEDGATAPAEGKTT